MANSTQQVFNTDEATGPVECLGMTFESDNARRKYFTELLRQKLQDPEFRAIEGFPIGEDDDILAMSDPPYYTACPNPFLNDFLESTQPTGKKKKHEPRKPFTADVSEGKKDPIYTAHGYHTKVPHKAIMRYLLHYTDPGDVVFDGFCGTGMTGVAAQLCGSRTEVASLGYGITEDGGVYEKTGGKGKDVFAQVGRRRAVLNDLSPAAAFIAGNYCSPIDSEDFAREAKRILTAVQDEVGWMYETLHEDGKTKGRIDYTVWSDVFACGECAGEIVFVDEALDRETGKIIEPFPCPHCAADCTKNNLDLQYESQMDNVLGKSMSMPKRKPVFINYTVRGKKYEKKPDAADLDVIARAARMPMPAEMPILEMPEMQMRRVGRMQPANISYIHQFFLPRAAQTLCVLWREASAIVDERLKQKALFFVEQAIWGMSLLNRYSPSHFSQTNRALSGVFYIASQISEVSPWYNLTGKSNRLKSTFANFRPSVGVCSVTNGDLASIPLAENSIDYIFTDPPFGENIYYSDLNILVESWHKVRTAPTNEVIVDRVKEKTLLDYQRLMQDCFKLYYKVLKPGRWMTVEFHNSKNSVWNAIQEGLEHAGFVVADVRTLDKKQGSFQQVVSGNTVKRDLIISAYKPNGGLEKRFKSVAGTEDGVWDFVNTHLKQLPVFVQKAGNCEPIAERMSLSIFDRMVAFHFQRNVSVPMSAAEFRAAMSERYKEIDGMFFLEEQVEEYERKRLTVESVEQLELFVSDEASAIQWLRQQLKEKPQTFQELTPRFMKQIASWEKHERSIELKELLGQNFFLYEGADEVPSQIHRYLSSNFKELRNLSKDDPTLRAKAKNRWYVPDPRKEVDLEKYRVRSLMKEFQEYVAAKGKLKVLRTEALRVGFADCWTRKDFATIIAVSRKVKEDIILEDPKLMFYYDNAVMLTED